MSNQTHIMKASNYHEEPEKSLQHFQSFLFPIEAVNGFAFGVLNSHSNKEAFKELANVIDEHLERLSNTIDNGTNLAHRFEQLLQALNEDIARLYEEGSLTLRITDTAAVIGLSSKNKIIVSGFGTIAAQFLHKTEKVQYSVYDLARGMRIEEEAPSWNKAFLTVLDGDLHAGDVLYIGDRINHHDIPLSEFNEILTTLPPNSAMSKIRQYLPIQTVFGAVIIKADRIDMPEMVSDQTAESSLNKLGRTEQKTNQYLGEQKPEVRGILLKIWQLVFPKRTTISKKSKLQKLLRFLLKFAIVFITVAGNIIVGSIKFIALMAVAVIKNPNKIIETWRQTRSKTKTGITKGIGYFNKLPKSSKYIIIGFLTVAFVFVASILFINKQQAAEVERVAFENSVKKVESKIENAEASLIYGDEDQARTLLSEAMTLVSELPEYKDRFTKSEELNQKIESQLNELRHLETVNLTTVVNVSEALGENSAEAIERLGDQLYIISSNGSLITVNENENSAAIVNVTGENIGSPKASTTSDDAVYWLDDGLARFIPETKELTTLTFAREAVDLQYYANRMYVLSPVTGQVYKHQKTTNGFDGGTAWIISGVTGVTDSVAMTIDGFVWILKNDGTILKYLSGREEEWSNTVVDPQLEGATDFWTDENSNYLYALDANQSRIVVFEKDSGNLVVQYDLSESGELKDMEVDEENKLIRVLTGNELKSFAMIHL